MKTGPKDGNVSTRDGLAAAVDATRRLDLSKKQLASIDHLHTLAGPHLAHLNLANNRLSDLSPLRDLGCGEALHVLQVSGNELAGKLPLGAFPQLRALIANDNQITHVAGLDRMSQLNTLVLSSNRVSQLEDVFPSGAVPRTMQKLSLARNPLSNLPATAFRRAESLVELRLGHTNISSLPPSLSQATKLRIVDLSGCPLTDWESLSVLAATRVKNLSLVGTPLASLDRAAYEERVLALLPQCEVLDNKRVKEHVPQPVYIERLLLKGEGRRRDGRREEGDDKKKALDSKFKGVARKLAKREREEGGEVAEGEEIERKREKKKESRTKTKEIEPTQHIEEKKKKEKRKSDVEQERPAAKRTKAPPPETKKREEAPISEMKKRDEAPPPETKKRKDASPPPPKAPASNPPVDPVADSIRRAGLVAVQNVKDKKKAIASGKSALALLSTSAPAPDAWD